MTSRKGPVTVPNAANRYPLRCKGFVWSGWPDLNRRPLDPQSNAPPSCATARCRHWPTDRNDSPSAGRYRLTPAAPRRCGRRSDPHPTEADRGRTTPWVQRYLPDRAHRPQRPHRGRIGPASAEPASSSHWHARRGRTPFPWSCRVPREHPAKAPVPHSCSPS